MQQYLELLKTIKEKGTYKAPAREGMPGTTSYFGYQFRHNLQDGFPLLTTKKLSFKNIVVELLWFLKGDTNIKYLVDNDCNIWNEDAYNYYVKLASKNTDSNWNPIYHAISMSDEDKTAHKGSAGGFRMFTFEEFTDIITNTTEQELIENYSTTDGKYTLGSTGCQYGWLWRSIDNWQLEGDRTTGLFNKPIDQIKELIKGLRENPNSRRHIISAWNVPTLDNMALNACHTLVQFNCRPLTEDERYDWVNSHRFKDQSGHLNVDDERVPKYYLDCQLLQRSGDVFLGIPYNTASYALLIHIIAKLCNMIPGEFVHTLGDAHIYDNHMTQVDEQLKRTPTALPKFELVLPSTLEEFEHLILEGGLNPNYLVACLNDYVAQPNIKAKLSTGLR